MPLRSSQYIESNNTFVSTVAPTITDDITQGAYFGAQWLNTTSNVLYKCVSTASGAAVWAQIGSGTGLNAMSIPVTFADWTEAALSAPFTIFNLPAGAKILDIDIVQSSAASRFSGPSISAAHLEVGITGTVAKYCALTDVHSAGQNLTIGAVAGYESLTVATPIIATLVVVGANLSVLTSGAALINVSYLLPTVV